MTREQAKQLAGSLEAMIDNIGGGKPIGNQLNEIGRLQQEVASTAPPQLSHFLENRSYTKALEYLRTGLIMEDPNRPDCDEEEAHP